MAEREIGMPGREKSTQRELDPASAFRRIALSFPGAEQGSHMGAVDFRVGGRIFATLASIKHGYGNLMLTPELQSAFVQEQPEIFLPIHGGWGRSGATHIRLAQASGDILTGALHTAYKLRVEKNGKTARASASPGTGIKRTGPAAGVKPKRERKSS